MALKTSRGKKVLLILFVLFFSGFLFLYLPRIENSNPYVPNKANIKDISSANGSENNNTFFIIYFKNNSYNSEVEDRFEFYGGKVREKWNNTFPTFCGFAGEMSQDALLENNLTTFQAEYPNITVENDETIEAQLNFASIQSGAINSTWYETGYKGDTNSSIVVLDSGIDLSHKFLQNKIRENISFIDGESPSDVYGHGTYIGSVIAGTGTDPYNSSTRNQVHIARNISHSEIFDSSINPRNYSLKLATFNISEPNNYIFLNSSWELITEGIDEFWIQLYHENELLNQTSLENTSTYYLLNQSISEDELGLYDIVIKYHKELYRTPQFSISTNIEFFPEFYIQNYSYFTGIANASKLINYKVLNNTGKGKVSNLISAFEFIYKNKNSSKILSACLSVGTLGSDISAINRVISEISEEGILIIIAAGNYGIQNSETLNSLGKNKNAIVVGAINDIDQVTSFSSMGTTIGGNIIKPDIVAPGGSELFQHRSIISAMANRNITTSSSGTSISTAIVSAAINLLIEAKWGNWSQWNSLNTTKWSKILKSILLMSATETNREREDNPRTEIDESQYSPPLYQSQINSTHYAGVKDEHEGYGRVNIQAAIDALTKIITPNITYEGHLASSQSDALGIHAFARKINLTANHQYLFNLSDISFLTTFDIYLYANSTNQYGEPILLESSRKRYGSSNYLYFTPRENETQPIMVIKAIQGESNFTLNITEVVNEFDPELKIPEVSYLNGPKNTTVLSLSEIQGDKPKNNITIDRYRFYVDYFDNDTKNVPPQQIYIYIKELAKNFTLTQLNPEDTNYTDGAQFFSSYIELPENRTYHYQFFVKDGLRNASLPTDISSFFTINITIPTTIKNVVYNNHFNNSLDNWTFTGEGWNILYQNNSRDNRSRIYKNEWRSVYFGSHHNYPKNYTYQPTGTDSVLNGSFTSPYFNLTRLGNNFTPFAKIGLRGSINELDSIELLINVNGTGWREEPINVYSNFEEEWFLDEFNLTQYKGNYIKFRFNSSVDDLADFVNYKGFIIDYFAIENHSNISPPEINFSSQINVQFDEKDLMYQHVQFSLEYFDQDNNYPKYVYLEIDNTNYSMVNYFGDWNASSNIMGDKGIYFARSLALDAIANRSFKFFVSDGNNINYTQYYNRNNDLITYNTPNVLEYNVFQDHTPIGFEYSNSLRDKYVTGTPVEKERTTWLQGDNTWHKVYKSYQYYLYGGRGQGYSESFRGYGQEWNTHLITKPVKLLSQHSSFLEYTYHIDLQNEASLTEDERDYCQVSVSTDYGENWESLKKYYYNSEELPQGNESIDISEYGGETIMIRFTLHSNDYSGGSEGYGWLISNIYVGYDRDIDHRPNEIMRGISYYLTQKANIERDSNQIVDPLLIFYIMFSITVSIGTIFGVYKSLLYLIEIRNIATSKDLIKDDSKLKSLNYKKKNVELKNAIKQLEKTQENKPLILHCKYCKSWYYSNKDFDIICPNCGRDQLYAAYNCINCEKWYFKDTPNEDYICNSCNVKLLKQDKEMLQDLIHEKGKILREYKKKKEDFSILDSNLD